MNHSGDANKMVETPRTDAEYERLFEIYQNAERINGPLCCAFENDMRLCRQLERELNAATSEIERLRKANLQLREGAEEQKQRIKRLEDCAETAWGIIANVDSGSWQEQRADWREAATRWRDEQFYPELNAITADTQKSCLYSATGKELRRE